MTPEMQQAMDDASPEQWKPVVGYGGLYEVSDRGRIRALFDACRGRHKAGRILKQKTREHGYQSVALWKQNQPEYRSTHSIVLESFIGSRPEGMEARHLDGVRKNNLLSNLKWGTVGENAKDRIDHGRMPRGENHAFAKLTNSGVLSIRKLWDEGLSAKKISGRFKTTVMRAWKIGKRKAWKHVPESL